MIPILPNLPITVTMLPTNNNLTEDDISDLKGDSEWLDVMVTTLTRIRRTHVSRTTIYQYVPNTKIRNGGRKSTFSFTCRNDTCDVCYATKYPNINLDRKFMVYKDIKRALRAAQSPYAAIHARRSTLVSNDCGL